MKNQITNRSRTCVLLSCCAIVLAVVLSVFGWGLNLGIDFVGGIQFEAELGQAFDIQDAGKALQQAGYRGDGQIVAVGANQTKLQIRIKAVDNSEEIRASLEQALKAQFPEMSDVTAVDFGPIVGSETCLAALYALLFAAALVFVYHALRFDLYSGLATVLGILHDVLLTGAIVALLGAFIPVSKAFGMVLLVVLGYSMINSTLLFARLRECLRKPANRSLSREENAKLAIAETRTNALIMVVMALVMVIALAVLGNGGLRALALPLGIGAVVCFYSSTHINGFVWAGLAAWGNGLKKRGKKA